MNAAMHGGNQEKEIVVLSAHPGHPIESGSAKFLAPEQRAILFNALVNDQVYLLITSSSRCEQIVKEGVKGLNEYSDEDLLKAAVASGLGISLAGAGFERLADTVFGDKGKPLFDGWLAGLHSGDEVIWTDPAEAPMLDAILEFHDLSREFWDSLTLEQKEQVAIEAGETWPSSSGTYRVLLVVTQSGQVESRDSVLVLKNEAGLRVEVLAHELSPLMKEG